MLKSDSLPVIFRAERSGDHKGQVTAVFPSLYHGNNLWVCYAHIGRHSACSRDWYRATRAATPEEYAALLSELRGIYETPPKSWEMKPIQLRVTKRAKWSR